MSRIGILYLECQEFHLECSRKPFEEGNVITKSRIQRVRSRRSVQMISDMAYISKIA
jgi:hypothetical protein